MKENFELINGRHRFQASLEVFGKATVTDAETNRTFEVHVADGKTMNFTVSTASLSANPFNVRSIGERVEDWHSHGIPAGGLSASERAEVIADAQGSFMAEFVGKAEAELQALKDKELVATYYWAMHEATR